MCNIPNTPVIPQHLQEDIVNRLEDAVHLARVKCVCKSFRYAANRVRSLRIVCKEEYHASIRDENPITALADVKPISRGGNPDTVSTSQADGAPDDIQKAKNDNAPPVGRPPHDTQNPSGTGTGFPQDCQSDSGIGNKHALETVAEGEDAPNEVVGGSDGRKRTRGGREILTEAEVCNQQPPSNLRSSDQAPQNSSGSCDTSQKGYLPETLRDNNGNFPDESSKKPRLEGDLHAGDSQAGKASTPEAKKETDREKGHAQETQRDDNGNFLDGSSKKPKLEGEFAAENPQDRDASTSGAGKEPIYFREIVPTILRQAECVVQLRIEIEPKLQSKVVPEAERKCTDHWMTDQLFVNKWIRYIQTTIQHLCIVDYGHQAIMRKSKILAVLSQTCFLLKTLDLRNMFLETQGCKDMPHLASFTLRCVKVNGNVLQEINMRMRNLQTLVLLGVFGVQEGALTLPDLKVLCLGLLRKAKLVKIELPNLVKLQLKMSCPETLHIYAPVLQFVAFNLEILNCTLVGFEHVKNLRELLYGASQFVTLSKLVWQSALLNKMFLDIPCMALDEDGNWLGVLNDVPLNVPPFEMLQSECLNMQVLNIGPGLWHSMETVHYPSLARVRAWPPITRLILHMIPHTLDTSVAVLLFLVAVMPKLQILEVKVHANSPVDYNCFVDAIRNAIESHATHLTFRAGRWTKSLDFSCFSF